jgi:hypothetical protein
MLRNPALDDMNQEDVPLDIHLEGKDASANHTSVG